MFSPLNGAPLSLPTQSDTHLIINLAALKGSLPYSF
jgi:hypothetical protein